MTNPLYDNLFAIHAGKTTPFLRLLDGQVISHQEFLAMTAQIANATTQLGLKPGDRLAAQVEKSPKALTLYAACIQAGLVFLPLNTAYTIDELSYFIEDSGASLIVCDENSAENLSGLASSLAIQVETLNADGRGTIIDIAEVMPASFTTVARAGDDLAALLYTSGTTGRSKGTMLTQNNLLSNVQSLVKEWRFTEEDVLLHALPIFHTHGLFVAANIVLATGCSMIFMPKFDLDHILEQIADATTMMGIPTFYTRLFRRCAFSPSISSHICAYSSPVPLRFCPKRTFSLNNAQGTKSLSAMA